ncbi:MAG: hypothetical protein PHQ89_03460 [Bacilli bacterium]|nr:hypothetical protein [Bacilli bacterium]
MIKTEDWLQKIEQLQFTKDRLKKKSEKMVYLRLLAFLVIVAGFLFYLQSYKMIFYLLVLVGVVLFVAFVYHHSKIKKAMIYNQYHLQVIQRYIDRRTDEWMNFLEKGETFIETCDPTFLDLDVIGNRSLYQLLCVGKSALGKRRLYEYFAVPVTLAEITKRREAIEELADKLDDSIQLQIALEAKLSEDDKRIEYQNENLKTFTQLEKIKGLVGLRWLPLFTLVIACLSFLSILPVSLFYVMLTIQFLIAAIISIRQSKRIACYQGIHDCYAKDANLYAICEKLSFNTDYLNKQQQAFKEKGKASQLLKKLDIYLSMFSLRNNIILYIVFNALFMFDIQYLFKIENWRLQYANYIQEWGKGLAEIEALLSCSLLQYAKDVTCIPMVEKSAKQKINAMHCTHPLINEQKAVYNDFVLKNNCIITGSNMSGKSTFMRCVGLNVLLANAGCRVCADEFSCSCMQLISSMRLKDELASGVSSFYAEILRIKTIMETSRKQVPVLILIDEIFKGTNSIDRISGAKEVIHKLVKPWIIAMITTHDLELCDEIEDLSNYHFEEHYLNNEIHFDYLLHEGKCKTTNAIYLMKMAGIID